MPEAAETQGLSAHDAAMLAKVDEAHKAAATAVTPEHQIQPAAEGTQKAARPDHIPEKFWDAEKGVARWDDLAKSYAELEAKTSKPAATDTPKDPTEGTDPLKAAQAKGVDVAAMQAEFDKSGALSEDSYKALEGVGFGKEVVDAYIAGQTALAEKAVNAAHELVGGADNFKSMLEWAGTGLSAAEVQAFNQAVLNPALSKAAILGVKAQWEAAQGTEPKLLSGAGPTQSGAPPFASRAEVTEAMRDPRYRSDPAYRALVTSRIDAMSSF